MSLRRSLTLYSSLSGVGLLAGWMIWHGLPVSSGLVLELLALFAVAVWSAWSVDADGGG